MWLFKFSHNKFKYSWNKLYSQNWVIFIMYSYYHNHNKLFFMDVILVLIIYAPRVLLCYEVIMFKLF